MTEFDVVLLNSPAEETHQGSGIKGFETRRRGGRRDAGKALNV